VIEYMSAAVIDHFDGPEIAQLSVAIVGLIGTLAAVIVANRGRQHARVSRVQLENEHQQTDNPNLREDLDAKDATTQEKLDKVIKQLGSVRDDIGLLKAGWRDNRTDIDDLMDTDRRRREMMSWAPPPTTRRERRARSV
jgi:hypothetical protein